MSEAGEGIERSAPARILNNISIHGKKITEHQLKVSYVQQRLFNQANHIYPIHHESLQRQVELLLLLPPSNELVI